MVTETQDINTSVISPSDSSMWIATSARGLVRVGKNGKSFTYSTEKGDFQSNNIVSLTFDEEGVLWFKDDQDGVYSYTSFTGFVKQSEVPQNIASALSEPLIVEEQPQPEAAASEAPRTVASWLVWLLTILLLICLGIIVFRRKPKPVQAAPSSPEKKSTEPAKMKPAVKKTAPAEKKADAPKPAVTVPLEGTFYEQVYKLAEQNFRNAEFGVEDIAAAFGISRVHLNRKLKAENSPSPSDIIKKMRMDMAAGMLKEGTHSISEIAQECGFSSASYFSSAFKEYFGVAPAAFDK